MANPSYKPNHRLNATGTNYGLAAGTAFVNTGVHYEIICVAGMQKGVVRIKTSGAGGTLDVFFIGPDVDTKLAMAQNAAYPPPGTVYTTGNATQGTVVAGTEQLVAFTPAGEDYAIVKFTATGTGTITYVDVAALSVGLE